MKRGADKNHPVALWQLGTLLALALALGLWLARPALALYQLEAGGQDMASGETFRAAHPTADNEFVDRALRHFQRAVEFTPADGYAYRRLGQAWLLAGNNNAAQEALSRAAELRPHDPLVHIELGNAWGGLGEAERAVAEYEQGGYGSAASEAIFNYLKLADWRVAAGSGDLALKILEGKVLALDPNNLPALHRVATIYEGAGKDGIAAAALIREQIKGFPVHSVAVPSEPRLAQYLAQSMIQVTEDGTWTRETLLAVIASQVWQFSEGPSSLGAEHLMQTLVGYWPHDPDLLFYQGELYRRRGDLELAEVSYEQVLAVDPAYAQAYLQLGMIAEMENRRPSAQHQGSLEKAAVWYDQYYRVLPGDLLGLERLAKVCIALDGAEGANGVCRQVVARVLEKQRDETGAKSFDLQLASRNSPGAVLWTEWLNRVATAEPEHLIGQRLDNGWTFLGYDADEERLVRDEPASLLLYWVGPVTAKAGSERDGWYPAGERWVQVLEGVQNLVLNGSFELGLEGESPVGFPGDIYGAALNTRRLENDIRVDRPTTVALLDNTKEYDRTSFVSTYFPVKADALYLQAGWLKSVKGNGFMGRAWLGKTAEEVPEYDYVIAGATVDDWVYYAGTTQPAEGAIGCQVWLINFKATGKVYFDDILFVEIGFPGMNR